MPARTLTVRGVPDATLRALRAAAGQAHRSLNGELLTILEHAAAERPRPRGAMRVREPALAPPMVPTLDVDRGRLGEICRRFRIRSVALFGSHARGDARPDSDVDLLIEFEPGMTPGFGILAVAEALSPAFGGRQVDLVTARGLSPRFKARIMAEAVPLHAD
jgi:hypothetical protein